MLCDVHGSRVHHDMFQGRTRCLPIAGDEEVQPGGSPEPRPTQSGFGSVRYESLLDTAGCDQGKNWGTGARHGAPRREFSAIRCEMAPNPAGERKPRKPLPESSREWAE